MLIVANLTLKSLEKAMAFSTWSKNARVTMESGRGLGKMALRSETMMEWLWNSEKPLAKYIL